MADDDKGVAVAPRASGEFLFRDGLGVRPRGKPPSESRQDIPSGDGSRLAAHAASLAISPGANVKVVRRMLGNASAAMTLDVYADLFDSDLAAMADKLDETVGKLWAERGQEDADERPLTGELVTRRVVGA